VTAPSPTSITFCKLPLTGATWIFTGCTCTAKIMGLVAPASGTFPPIPRKVRLGDFRFRINERFLYEYDFGDRWEHEVRIERRLPMEAKKVYPVCVRGRRAGPEEDCGGPEAYMAWVDHQWCHPPLEDVSTAFVESTIDQVVSKRMMKRQQMRWSQRGAHLLLRVRTRALDGFLRDDFIRWHPGMKRVAGAQPDQRWNAA
jgi:Plasmid pRiA4b ORF-3-like protein